MCGNRSARAKQLLPKYAHFIFAFWEPDEEPDDAGSITLCAVSEFLWPSFLLSAFPISTFLSASCRPWSFAEVSGKTNIRVLMQDGRSPFNRTYRSEERRV